MSVLRGLTTVLVCCVGFGVAGGLLGLALGVGAPSYYRAVFGARNDPGFNPAQVGAGLGTTQGFVCGVVVGCVVVFAAALSGPRRPKSVPVDFAGHPVDFGLHVSTFARQVLVLVVVLIAIACAGGVGFVLGGLYVTTEAYRRSSDAKLAKVQPILKSEFARVSASDSSDGEVYLNGTVDSVKDYKALQDRVRFLFGDDEARSMMEGVKVGKD